jgi:hypothetical protein
MSRDMWQREASDETGEAPACGGASNPHDTRRAGRAHHHQELGLRVRSHLATTVERQALRHQPTHHCEPSPRLGQCQRQHRTAPRHGTHASQRRHGHKTTLTGHTVSFDDMGKFLRSILGIVYAVIFRDEACCVAAYGLAKKDRYHRRPPQVHSCRPAARPSQIREVVMQRPSQQGRWQLDSRVREGLRGARPAGSAISTRGAQTNPVERTWQTLSQRMRHDAQPGTTWPRTCGSLFALAACATTMRYAMATL